MAWAAVTGAAGASNLSTPFGRVVSAAAIAASANNVFAIALATDNVTTSDGASSDHYVIWDNIANSQNVYSKLGEYTYGGGGTAEAGVTVSLWACMVASAIATSTSLTFLFASTKRVGFVFETFTKGLSYLTRPGISTRIDAAADAGALTVAGLAAAEHLFLRATGHEGPSTDALTPSASYTSAGKGGTNVGGPADEDITVGLEYRILNATSDSTDPTWTVADHASIMVALDESSTAPHVYSGANHPVLTIQLDIQGS